MDLPLLLRGTFHSSPLPKILAISTQITLLGQYQSTPLAQTMAICTQITFDRTNTQIYRI